MICQRCGVENLETANFCTACGDCLQTTPISTTQNQKHNSKTPYSRSLLANKTAGESLTFGIISIVLIGPIFGIIAIAYGIKAKRLGYTGGKAKTGIIELVKFFL